tara:strand:- start:6329 stop:8467 length:2139 start_codon:yes stop_codon:yes gene_type:complete
VKSRISFIATSAKGGISQRNVDLDTDVIRFGRSTDNEIFLKDPRVPLHLAELRKGPSGTFVEAKGATDLRYKGSVTRSVQVELGETIALGPFDLTFVSPPAEFEVAALIELKRPLGDDLEELRSRSTISIDGVGVSKRRWSVGLSLLILAVFAVVPVAGVLSPELHRVSQEWPVSVDSAWEPGQLSVSHGFFGDDCSHCHLEPFAPISNVTCSSCHELVTSHGDPSHYTDVSDVSCVSCHKEHRGWASPTSLDTGRCINCHENLTFFAKATTLGNVSDFVDGHPAFSDAYPHSTRTAINFDHGKHYDTHFVDQRYVPFAPAGCESCHQVELARTTIPVRSFGETCAACHAEQIMDRDLVLLRLPELEEPVLDSEDLVDVCGPTVDAYEQSRERLEVIESRLDLVLERMKLGDAVAELSNEEFGDQEEEEEEQFESISFDELTSISAFLLDVEVDDVEAYGPSIIDLVASMADEGVEPLHSLIADKTSEELATELISGLNAEAVKRLACAWAANLEYESPGESVSGGWYGDYLELKYRPGGHADPVVRRWLDAVVASSVVEASTKTELIDSLREDLLSKQDGPGACIKCHGITETMHDNGTSTLAIQWQAQGEEIRPHHAFSHDIHLKLARPGASSVLDPELGCANCHELDFDSPYAESFEGYDLRGFSSNFSSINRETCIQCHGFDGVDTSCQLCHRYHAPQTLSTGSAASQ